MNQWDIRHQLHQLAESALNAQIADLLSDKDIPKARLLRDIRGQVAAALAESIQTRYIIRTPPKR